MKVLDNQNEIEDQIFKRIFGKVGCKTESDNIVNCRKLGKNVFGVIIKISR